MDNFETVEDDSPDRCQGMTDKGQCHQKRVMGEDDSDKGSEFCIMHGGSAATRKKNKKDLRSYYLRLWGAEARQVHNPEFLKSLRDEIVILRMMLQNIINEKIDSSTSLILMSGKIIQIIGEIRSTVESCNKLEKSTGELLDLQTLFQFGDEVITLITEVLDGHPKFIREISEGLLKILGRLRSDQ